MLGGAGHFSLVNAEVEDVDVGDVEVDEVGLTDVAEDVSLGVGLLQFRFFFKAAPATADSGPIIGWLPSNNGLDCGRWSRKWTTTRTDCRTSASYHTKALPRSWYKVLKPVLMRSTCVFAGFSVVAMPSSSLSSLV